MRVCQYILINPCSRKPLISKELGHQEFAGEEERFGKGGGLGQEVQLVEIADAFFSFKDSPVLMSLGQAFNLMSAYNGRVPYALPLSFLVCR